MASVTTVIPILKKNKTKKLWLYPSLCSIDCVSMKYFKVSQHFLSRSSTEIILARLQRLAIIILAAVIPTMCCHIQGFRYNSNSYTQNKKFWREWKLTSSYSGYIIKKILNNTTFPYYITLYKFLVLLNIANINQICD